jgi:hypothetical protein
LKRDIASPAIPSGDGTTPAQFRKTFLSAMRNGILVLYDDFYNTDSKNEMQPVKARRDSVNFILFSEISL